MLILIKSKPYETENVMGALYIALSVSDSKIPTSVVFLEDGIYSLIKDQN
jgi:sulfur relay (sulfurtransferase) DsrF/TusC family protein